MCNSKRTQRFDCTRPPFLAPPERTLSLHGFVKSLVLAAKNGERDLILVNDDAKSMRDNTTSSCRVQGEDLSLDWSTMRLGSECMAAASSPRLPATKRKHLSRWDSGEAKSSSAGDKYVSGLCAPIRPKKSQESAVVEPGLRSRSGRRVRFALPTCTDSASPLLTSNVQPTSCISKSCSEKMMNAGSDIISKQSMGQHLRKVAFSGVPDMDAPTLDIPPRLVVRSTNPLVESICENSFSELSVA